ncbi:MAG: hypothetical protein ACPGEG_09600 [Salibacteraceae bacterium]
MNQQDNMQDKLFQDAFANAEVTPPPAAWEGISSAMVQKKRRRGFIYFSTAAAILIGLFAVTFISISTSNQNKTLPNKLAQQPKVKEVKPKKEQIQEVKQQQKLNTTEISVKQTEEVDIVLEKALQKELVNPPNKKQNASVLATENSKKDKEESRLKSAIVDIMNHVSYNSNETTNRIASVNREIINDNNSTIEYLDKKSVLFKSNSQLKLDLKPQEENIEWVNTHKKLNLIFGLYYSPIFTNNNLVNSNDIAFNQTIVQDNLVHQEIKNYTVDYHYSQQFGFQIGKNLTEKIDVLAGVEYSNWKGTADLYLQNNYETKFVLSQEIGDERTIREINEKINEGTISDNEDLIGALQVTGVGSGTFESLTSTGLTSNAPTNVQLTGSDSASQYESITVTRNSTYDDTVTTKFTYTYYEIPLIIRYKMGNKRLKGVISGGFSTVFGRKTELYSVAISQFDRSSESTISKASFQQWNALLNVGIQYQINSKWSINAMPFAKWNLNGSNNKTSNGKGYMGFQFGAEINL